MKIAGHRDYYCPLVDLNFSMYVETDVDKTVKRTKDEKTGEWSYEGIDGQFDDACDFRNGLAAVKRGEKWGYINKKGEIVIPPRYYDAGYFGKEYAVANDEYEEYCVKQYLGVINRKGEEVFCGFEIIKWYGEDMLVISGYYKAPASKCKTKYFGLIEQDGDIAVSVEYPSFRTCYLGESSDTDWRITGNLKKNVGKPFHIFERKNQSVLIDPKRKEPTTFPCSNIYLYENCVAGVTENWKGVFSYNGETLIPMAQQEITVHKNGLISTLDSNGERVFDSTGKPASSEIFDKTEYTMMGYVRTWKNGMQGAIFSNPLRDIPPIYDSTGLVNDDLIAVCKNARWGYADLWGNIVIEPRFDKVFSFTEGLARVVTNGRVGYIDKKGNEVIHCKYSQAYDCANGICFVKALPTRRFGFINEHGDEISPKRYDSAEGFSTGLALVSNNGLYGYVNSNLQEVIPLSFANAKSFSEGLAPVKVGNKWGYIAPNGTMQIPPQYDEADEFLWNAASVKKNSKRFLIDKSGNKLTGSFQHKIREGESRNKWGYYLNSRGEWVVLTDELRFKSVEAPNFSRYVKGGPLVDRMILEGGNGKQVSKYSYTSISEALTGHFIVYNGEKYGLINSRGEEVLPLVYSYIKYIEDGGYLIIWKKSSGSNYMFEPGEFLLDQWQSECRWFIGDYAVIRNGDNEGAVNKKGEFVVPPEFWGVEHQHGKFWRVKTAEGYFLYNADTEERTPYPPNCYGYYRNGLFTCYQKKKYGLCKADGSIVVPPQYDEVSPASTSIWALSTGKKEYFYVASENKLISAGNYTDLGNGMFCHRKEKKLALADSTLAPLTPYMYTDIERLSEDLFLVEVDSKQGCIDKNGKEVIPVKYDSLHFQGSGMFLAKNEEMWGLIDMKSEVLVPFKKRNLGNYKDGYFVSKHGHQEKLTAIDMFENEKTDEYLDKFPQIKEYDFVRTGEGSKSNPANWSRVVFKHPAYTLVFNERTPVCGGCSAFYGNHAIVQIVPRDRKRIVHFSYIDNTGYASSPPALTKIRPMMHSLGVVEKGNRWGAINTKGEEVVPFKFAWLGNFTMQTTQENK